MTARQPAGSVGPVSPLPFGRNRFLQLLIIGYGAFWIATAIDPYFRYGWWLENILVFLGVGVAVATYRRFPFSNLSYLCFVLFLSLHTLGAYYSYTTTPIDVMLHRLFDFERDMFDRVVHTGFGLLLAYPLWEWLVRAVRLERRLAYLFAVVGILAAGAFYEMIEMWVAKLVDPEAGTLFLGTQGDEWDAVQDIAVAFYGAALAMGTAALAHRLGRRRVPRAALASQRRNGNR